jgi:hypothetical protein
MEVKTIHSATMPNIVAGVYGEVEIVFDTEEQAYFLYHNGIPWMGTDKEFMHPKDTLYSQYDLAYGDVLLTGLGFGILAVALAQKDTVSSVTVLELNSDVIKAFLNSNPENDKIKIVLGNATNYVTDSTYDCLFPDHYEFQSDSWKLNDMASIFKRIKTETYWPWSIERLFFKKEFPKDVFGPLSEEYINANKDTITNKWKSFVLENSIDHPSLLNLDSEKLAVYLNKWVRPYNLQ